MFLLSKPSSVSVFVKTLADKRVKKEKETFFHVDVLLQIAFDLPISMNFPFCRINSQNEISVAFFLAHTKQRDKRPLLGPRCWRVWVVFVTAFARFVTLTHQTAFLFCC